MQITIVVDDKTVYCGGVAVQIPALDWAKFDGEPGSPWDDIAAVQFNTASSQGHVEYREIETRQAMRPNMRPPDMRIGVAEFNADFAWVLPYYEDALSRQKIEAERQAAQAAVQSAAFEAQPQQTASVSSDDIEALRSQLAAQKAENERLAALSESTAAKLDAIFAEVGKEAGGGE